jgi:hypothetical protein
MTTGSPLSGIQPGSPSPEYEKNGAQAKTAAVSTTITIRFILFLSMPMLISVDLYTGSPELPVCGICHLKVTLIILYLAGPGKESPPFGAFFEPSALLICYCLIYCFFDIIKLISSNCSVE